MSTNNMAAVGNFQKEYAELRSRIHALPDHSDAEIAHVAQQLDMLHFKFEMGRIERDIVNMDKKKLLGVFDEIANWSFDDAVANRNFEPEYGGGDKSAYASTVKLERMKFLLRKFEFLSRLRSDDPEAWDTVNELYFDD